MTANCDLVYRKVVLSSSKFWSYRTSRLSKMFSKMSRTDLHCSMASYPRI